MLDTARVSHSLSRDFWKNVTAIDLPFVTVSSSRCHFPTIFFVCQCFREIEHGSIIRTKAAADTGVFESWKLEGFLGVKNWITAQPTKSFKKSCQVISWSRKNNMSYWFYWSCAFDLRLWKLLRLSAAIWVSHQVGHVPAGLATAGRCILGHDEGGVQPTFGYGFYLPGLFEPCDLTGCWFFYILLISTWGFINIQIYGQSCPELSSMEHCVAPLQSPPCEHASPQIDKAFGPWVWSTSTVVSLCCWYNYGTIICGFNMF